MSKTIQATNMYSQFSLHSATTHFENHFINKFKHSSVSKLLKCCHPVSHHHKIHPHSQFYSKNSFFGGHHEYKNNVILKENNSGKKYSTHASLHENTMEEFSKKEKWGEVTEKLTALSSLVGIFMMMPQILKNFQNLSSNQFTNLSILSWESYTSGLLGNLLLLSYFVSKKETSAIFVQGIGSFSTFVLLYQIFLAGYMPPVIFYSIALLLMASFVVNYFRYNDAMPDVLWKLWQSFSSVIGLAILPQVFCLTFGVTKSFFPFFISGSVGILISVLLQLNILPPKFEIFWTQLSAWFATLLFMIMPIPQLKACIINPLSLIGLSFLSPFLSMSANALMIPRALFIRDFMWLTGCSWGSFLMGWSILFFMAYNKVMNFILFSVISLFYALYLTAILVKNFSIQSVTR